MRRKTAKEILAHSFREIAVQKPIDKITVREITENCGYSPATFYRQFQDKYDLIAWEYTRGVAKIMGQIGVNGYPWKQTLLDGANRFQAEKEYLANLLLHTGGYDSFVRNMTEINYRALRQHILESTGEGELEEKTDMYVRIYCLGTVSLTCEWILGRYQASPEELAEVFEQSLPVPLRSCLMESEEREEKEWSTPKEER